MSDRVAVTHDSDPIGFRSARLWGHRLYGVPASDKNQSLRYDAQSSGKMDMYSPITERSAQMLFPMLACIIVAFGVILIVVPARLSQSGVPKGYRQFRTWKKISFYDKILRLVRYIVQGIGIGVIGFGLYMLYLDQIA